MAFKATAKKDCIQEFNDLCAQFEQEIKQQLSEDDEKLSAHEIAKKAEAQAKTEFSTVYCTDGILNNCDDAGVAKAFGISKKGFV